MVSLRALSIVLPTTLTFTAGRDTWAKTKSFNKDVKVYIGAPASSDAAGTGYVDNTTLAKYATDAQNKYSSMGGVMLWDVSEAYGSYNHSSSPFLPPSRL